MPVVSRPGGKRFLRAFSKLREGTLALVDQRRGRRDSGLEPWSHEAATSFILDRAARHFKKHLHHDLLGASVPYQRLSEDLHSLTSQSIDNGLTTPRFAEYVPGNQLGTRPLGRDTAQKKQSSHSMASTMPILSPHTELAWPSRSPRPTNHDRRP